MKTLIASLLLATGTLHAASIPSIASCKLELYYSNPWKTTLNVENTRVSGKKAELLSNNLKATGASIKTHTDELGVKRYSTIEKRTVLESRGALEDSCEGIAYAMKVDTCTVDASNQTCETFCKFEWRGLDCR